MNKRANHYKVRTAALKELGFSSYRQYLASDLWRDIRNRVLKRDGNKCLCCGKAAYTAHHVTYSAAVLAGKEDSQLVSVCRSCHRKAEFNGIVKRKDAFSVHGALSRRARKNGKGKKALRENRPMCRCCRRTQKKPLGREGICLGCYKRFRERVHEVAKEQDELAMK